MSLRELTLFGEIDRVKVAIERLQQFEPLEGYYLAFSGGKDSVTIYCLAKMAGIQFDAHYHLTTVDPPELVQFIKSDYPNVEIHHPELSMWKLILKKGTVPMRNRRYCCEALKETGGAGRLVVTGVRWAESSRRKRRRMVETCFKDTTKTYVHPIIDWSNEDVWAFIRAYNVPYCSLYDKGFTRLGCIFCPMANVTLRDLAQWPKYVQIYIRTFDRLLEQGRQQGKEFTWKDGQELFEWWTRRYVKTKVHEAQLSLFE